MSETKPKVLIISTGSFFSTYGGGQVYVKNLVDELIRQGIYLSIATPGRQGDGVQEFRGCKVYTFDSAAKQSELEKLLRKINPDVVHAHGHKAPFAKACVAIGVPCIVTAHHGGILCPAGTLLNHRDQICRICANHRVCLPCVLKNIRGGIVAWPILRMFSLGLRLRIGLWLKKPLFLPYLTPVGQATLSIRNKVMEWNTICENAQLLIAPSRAIAESMAINGALKENITVIPHGIPLSEEARQKNSMSAKSTDTPIRFFFVGRICHVKGVHVMIEAFHQINGSAELHIVGGAGNKAEHRYMKRLVKKYKSDSRIIWQGKIVHDKVNELISRFDIMVHPSICMEVFGLNISEALAMGKPVIATRCGGAEMQIEDGVNGWLVDPNDIVALNQVILRVMKEPHLIEMISEQIGPVHSLESHIRELKTAYRETYEEKTSCH